MVSKRHILGLLENDKVNVSPGEIHNVDVVEDQSDLPDPQNGEHQLEDNTAYWFTGITTSPYTLTLGNTSPTVGTHAGVDGFIHTGGGTAIKGRDANYLQRNMYIHSPGGTIYDLQATNSDEMLVESCSFSDAAGLGDIANLGTVKGFRVPSWKDVNFEDFNAGLEFDGSPDKIFFDACPFRDVDNVGVTTLTFKSTLDVEIVDIVSSYVKGVQPDTEIIRVETGGTPNDIFQYRGVTHDNTVTESNILTGEAGRENVGYRVTDSYPLPNTRVLGSYSLDATATTTINTQAGSKTDAAAYERVSGSTTAQRLVKFTHTNNELTYEGRRTKAERLNATLSVGTGNSDTIAVAFFRNGNIVDDTPTRLSMNGQAGGIDKSINTIGVSEDVNTDDVIDVRVANLDSTTDIQVGELNALVSE